jgi:ABC-2 type transport system permease protein
MLSLLRIQLLKIASYRTFWVLIALFLVTFGIANFFTYRIFENIFSQVEVAATLLGAEVTIFDFPAIWANMAWLAGYYQMILAVIVVVDISNEFSFRTMRQNLIDGLDRRDFVLSKLWLIFVLSLATTLLLTLYTLTMGVIFSEGAEVANFWQGADYMLAFFVQCFGYLSVAMLVVVLLKRAGLAMIVLFLYSLIENAVALYYNSKAGLMAAMKKGEAEVATKIWTDFLPLQLLNNPIPPSFYRYTGFIGTEKPLAEEIYKQFGASVNWGDLGLAALTAVVLSGIAYLVLLRRDA